MFTYTYPSTERVVYGDDALDALPAECDALPASRVLLLTTRSLLGSHLLDRVTSLLGARCVGLLSDVPQHVPAAAVTPLLEQARELRPDALVGLGGGSVADAAKALAAGLASGYTSAEQVYRHRIRFTYPSMIEMEPFSGQPVPTIAIPTTLSAAEYDGIFGMTTDGVKDLYSDDRLSPRVVLLDPAAAAHTPRRLWSGTGIRALDHAIETYLSRTPTPVTDAATLHAVRLLAENLPKSQRDSAARLSCLQAGWLSMLGVANVTLGLSHGIGHQIGGLCGVPHGETSCIMLPVVLRRLVDVVPERLRDVAVAMGIDVDGMSLEQAAASASTAVRELVATLGLPLRLSEVGVRREDLPAIARASMEDLVVASAPLVVDERAVLELLEAAY